jgi:hypothetical protein
MTDNVAELELKVRALDDAISKLHGAKHAEQLVQIIHKPGWTTQRESELVEAHIGHFHHQVTGLHEALDTLMTIAEKIGTT